MVVADETSAVSDFPDLSSVHVTSESDEKKETDDAGTIRSVISQQQKPVDLPSLSSMDPKQ